MSDIAIAIAIALGCRRGGADLSLCLKDRQMTVCRALPALAVAAALSAAPTFARAETAKGEHLARQWCSSCHVIGTGTTRMVQPGPPSFRSIARRLSADEIRTFLTKPHGAMPDLSLSRSEIDALTAYIESLR